MKRRRLRLELSDRQQLAFALVMVLLLAISMLYCLGLASLTLRNNLENTPLPWNPTAVPPQDIDRPQEVLPGGPTLTVPSP